MLHRILTGLLAAAADRWPPAAQDEIAREWAAELHELGQEPAPRPLRTWRQLRFAASLAVARPDGAPVPFSGAAPRALALLAAPLLSLMATWVLLLVPEMLLQAALRSGTDSDAAQGALLLGEYLTLAVVAGLLGTRSARRPGGPAAAAAAALPAIAGVAALDLLAHRAWPVPSSTLLAAALLLVVLPPAAWTVARLARARRWLAWPAVVLGAPLLTAAAVLAAAHGSLRVFGPDVLPRLARPSFGLLPTLPPVDGPAADVAVSFLPELVLAAVALVLTHAVRAARPATGPAVGAGPVVVARAQGLWWHRSLLGGAVLSLVAWAVTLAYLTPNVGEQRSWAARNGGVADPLGHPPPALAGWPGWTWNDGRLWLQELQLLGIAVTVLCFLLALAHLGRPLLPALAGGGILLAADLAVVHADRAEPELLPWLVAGGLLLGAVAWTASIRLGPPAERSARRLVVTVTLLPLFLLPYPFSAHAYVLDRHLPPVLMLVVAGLPTVLAAVTAAGVHATTARPARLPAWQFPTLVAAAVVLAYQPGLVPRAGHGGALLLLLGPGAVTVPATVWAVAAIRGGPLTRRRLLRHLLLAPGLLLAGLVASVLIAITAGMIGEFALFPIEYVGGATYDDAGFPYVPGALAVGLVVASFAAARDERRATGTWVRDRSTRR